jgi:recombination protein RecA
MKMADKEENENKAKEAALEDAIKSIEKAYGKGAVMRMGEHAHVDVDVIPSGSLLLDQALGVGGFPRGRIVEVYGPESSGKTTLALHAVAEAQKKGGRAAYVDAEHAIDPEYAAKLGVDIDELILSQPDSGEQALEIVEMLAQSGAIDIIVVDSVAALVPQAELDGVMEDNQVGLQARLMSKAMRKLAGILAKSGCLVIFINQLREKVGVMYGNPETTTGGRALKFYASIRLDLRRADAIKNGSEIIGNSVKIKVVKNKVAPPFKTCVVDLLYGHGFAKDGEIVDLGVENGLVQKTGNWYMISGEKIGNGRDAAKAYMDSHPEVANDLEAKLRAILKGAPAKADDDGVIADAPASAPAAPADK